MRYENTSIGRMLLSEVTEKQSRGGRIPRGKKRKIWSHPLSEILTILKTFVGVLHTFKYIKDRFVFSIVKI